MNVLLVDDEPKNLFALRALLEDLGAAIHCAQSGEEALRQVLKHEYAAILLDVRMPGIDGYETAAAIRSLERLRRVPIIFLSAQDRRTQQRGAHDEHCEFVQKPLVPDDIRARVTGLLARRRQTAELQ